MVQIIPAILATSEEQFNTDLGRIESSGSFENGWVHIDFTDNIFVPNQTITPLELINHPIRLKKEAHLMVEKPVDQFFDLIRIDFQRILAHLELHYQEIDRFLEAAIDEKVEVGLAINPETPVSKLEPYLKDIDVVLFMSVKPGFQGQLFIPEILEKIKQCFKLRKDGGYHFQIGVDGGISKDNVKLVVEAGADYLILGSHLIKGNIEENLENLWEAIND